MREPDRTGAPDQAPLLYFTIASRLNRLPLSRFHIQAAIGIGIGLFFNFYDLFLITVIVTNFAEVKQSATLLTTVTFLGMFVGALLFSPLADAVGRRRAFLLTMVIYSTASLACAVSPNLVFLVVARGVTGVGIGAEFPISDAYLTDITPARYRGRITALAYTIGFCGVPVAGFLSHAFFSGTFMNVSGWRWLFVIGSLGALAAVGLRLTLPESPRWLEATGQDGLAAAAVSDLEQRIVSNSPLAVPVFDERVDDEHRISSLWTRPVYRRRWIMMLIFHTFQGIGYYGFGTLALLHLTNKGYSVVSSIGFISLSYLGYPLGSAASLFFIDSISRRLLTAWGGLLMTMCGLFLAFGTSATSVVIFGFLYTCFSNVFSNAFHVYQAELFPTELRATAIGIPYALSRLSIALMPLILVPSLHDLGSTTTFALIALSMVVASAAILEIGPESTKLPLERITSEMSRK